MIARSWRFESSLGHHFLRKRSEVFLVNCNPPLFFRASRELRRSRSFLDAIPLWHFFEGAGAFFRFFPLALLQEALYLPL